MEVVQAMTSIRPQFNLHIMPVTREPRGSGSTAKDADPGFTAKDADPGFTALVPTPGEAAAAGSTRTEEAALRSALAHIFNAYGFFPAPEAAAPGAAAATSDDMGPAAQSEPAPGEPPVMDSPPQAGSEHGPGPAPQASPRAVAVHAAGPRPAPEPGAGRPADSARPVEPHLRAIQNRLENEPALPEQASAKAADKRAAHAEQRDRVTLKIAEHSVELIARLSNLSDEEKQRLFDEIDSLLAAHGLSLAGATVNGEPFSQALGRAQ